MAAAAVVSVSIGVMKPVLAKLTTLMGDEYKKLKSLQKDVTFLQRELSDMDAFLEKMDSADELDPQAKKWRRDIIEICHTTSKTTSMTSCIVLVKPTTRWGSSYRKLPTMSRLSSILPQTSK
jgi:hypothetical protein